MNIFNTVKSITTLSVTGLTTYKAVKFFEIDSFTPVNVIKGLGCLAAGILTGAVTEAVINRGADAVKTLRADTVDAKDTTKTKDSTKA